MREEVVDQTASLLEADGPYVRYEIKRTVYAMGWNSKYDQDAKCVCGHAYYRHFDTYEEMNPVGCKYCDCFTFVPLQQAASFAVHRGQVVHVAAGYALVACYLDGKYGYAVGPDAPNKSDFRALKFFEKTNERSYEDALDYMRDLSRP